MDPQRELLQALHDELESDRPVVRAVIARTWGSTPRETGADMVLDMEGGLKGTVGGGCGEAEVYELAQELLHQPDPCRTGAALHVDLTESPDDGGDKVCGGRFDVLLHRLDPESHRDLVGLVIRRLDQGEPTSWETIVGDFQPGFWKEGLSRIDLQPVLKVGMEPLEEPRWETVDGDSTFCEPMGMTHRLVIVGAGHISRPLARMAQLAGYHVFVLDDRAEYARSDFFPPQCSVLCGEYSDHLPKLAESPRTSVVLVTRGHRHDQECLRLVAGKPLEYVGMIGSQRRVEAVFAELVEEGFLAEDLQKVCAPIGLEIGARTPAEISVSILAEMIQRRRTGRTGRKAQPRVRHQRSLRG